MQKDGYKVDWDFVIPVLKQAGIYELFLHINAICVEYLGFEALKPLKHLKPSDRALTERILEDIIQPEFPDAKPKGNVFQVITFKTRRFFANSWKRKLVYREGIMSQLWYGSIAHLKRFETIKD